MPPVWETAHYHCPGCGLHNLAGALVGAGDTAHIGLAADASHEGAAADGSVVGSRNSPDVFLCAGGSNRSGNIQITDQGLIAQIAEKAPVGALSADGNSRDRVTGFRGMSR